MELNTQHLKWIAGSLPENLCLLDNESLMRLYREEACDEQLQGNCLAELYVRWFIGDADRLRLVEGFLKDITPGGLPSVLLDLRLTQDYVHEDCVCEKFISSLWKGPDLAGECIERIVHERLFRLLMREDGFVPVYKVGGTGVGLFIPFELVPRTSSREPSVVDADGRIVKDWNGPSRAILGTDWRLRVYYHQHKGMPVLTQRSFLLPLQVALWKKKGAVPKFNSWQLLFTGEIDAGGRTVPVKIEAKRAGVSAVFQQSVRLVAPSDTPYEKETRGVDPIPAGIGGEDLLNVVPGKVEQMVKGCRFSRTYALDRLPCLEHAIRHEIVDAWDCQIRRVDALLIVLGKHVAPWGHLRLLMLKSAAYCHSGRTDDALRENFRALTYAREGGLVYEALRLEIEQLVEFQDSQRFNDIIRLARPLLARIKKVKLKRPEDRVDLLMRYYGTLGQIQMEECLLGRGKVKPTQAKASLEMACDCARQLKDPREELQDMHYLHLWYAFFDPQNDELKVLRQEIEGFHGSLDSAGERAKNRAFFRRQQAISAFMKWHRTGMVSSEWMMLEALPAGCETWLVASFMKAKGALAAAAGNTTAALASFAVGERSFPMQSWWSSEGDELSPGSVFAQIRLALLVQASCSLAKLAPESAERYRLLAIDLLSECPRVKDRCRVDELVAALENPLATDPRSLPVLYY